MSKVKSFDRWQFYGFGHSIQGSRFFGSTPFGMRGELGGGSGLCVCEYVWMYFCAWECVCIRVGGRILVEAAFCLECPRERRRARHAVARSKGKGHMVEHTYGRPDSWQSIDWLASIASGSFH